MMAKYQILFLSWLVCCLVATGVRAQPTVTLATLNWPPYIGQQLPEQGYVARLVREAYRVSGYAVDLRFLPWARAIAMTQAGQYDGYLPEYYAESLQAQYLLSDPFPGGPVGLFKRKDQALSFRTLEDLQPYRIGVVRGYINTVPFDRADFLKKIPATDDLTNLRKLAARHLDLVVADHFVGLYLLKQHLADQADQIEFMHPALEEKKLYLCISRKAPEAERKIRAFNDGLRRLKENGTLATLLKEIDR